MNARSYLFVPGDRAERFDKAWDSLADEVIIDLEDAVAPERKGVARTAVSAWLDPARPVWIRVNAMDSPWFAEDVALARHAGVAGVVLPKAETVPQPLAQLCDEREIGLMPLIETAAGLRACSVLAAESGVVRFAFGALDFQLDLGIEGDDDALLAFRSQLVLESRLAGLTAPVDGITAEVKDLDRVRSDAQRARRLGFGGKLCIHPQQVAEVNRAFSPSDQERKWANRILAAMKSSQGAAVALDGRMIDRPVFLKAALIAGAPAPDVRLRR